MQDAYGSVGITVPFSLVAGALTGGVTEVEAVRALTGMGVADTGAKQLLKAPLKEGGQQASQCSNTAPAWRLMRLPAGPLPHALLQCEERAPIGCQPVDGGVACAGREDVKNSRDQLLRPQGQEGVDIRVFDQHDGMPGAGRGLKQLGIHAVLSLLQQGCSGS